MKYLNTEIADMWNWKEKNNKNACDVMNTFVNLTCNAVCEPHQLRIKETIP